MNNYVCGFLFANLGKYVVLIKKNRPEWQKGLLNGVGGKIENSESELQAMTREFEEEAGPIIEDWVKFANLSDHRNYNVAFFYSHYNGHHLDIPVATHTDEKVEIVELQYFKSYETIPNLAWLIPMALSLRGARDITLEFDIMEKIS